MRDACRSTAYLLTGAVVGIVWASLLVSLLTVALSTLVLVVGYFLLLALARLIHWVDAVEACRAARFLEIEGPHRDVATREALADDRGGIVDRLRSEWSPHTCRRALAGVVRIVTAPVILSLTIILWVVPLALMSTPILVAVGLEPTGWADDVDRVVAVEEWPAAVAMTVLGLAALPGCVVIIRRLATAIARRRMTESWGEPNPAAVPVSAAVV